MKEDEGNMLVGKVHLGLRLSIVVAVFALPTTTDRIDDMTTKNSCFNMRIKSADSHKLALVLCLVADSCTESRTSAWCQNI
jgi:hypothetical protein